MSHLRSMEQTVTVSPNEELTAVIRKDIFKTCVSGTVLHFTFFFNIFFMLTTTFYFIYLQNQLFFPFCDVASSVL